MTRRGRGRLALAAALMLAAAQAAALMVAAAQAAAAQSVFTGPIANSQDTVQAGTASLRALDTLQGRTEDLTLRVGETARFGQLDVGLEACRVPREAPGSDAYAFLVIRDLREAAPRFSGWMIASSPALSALDHPRYDIWVLSCSNP